MFMSVDVRVIGISKSFRTEPVTECTITFLIGHCYPFRVYAKWVQCFSATAGNNAAIDLMESRV